MSGEAPGSPVRREVKLVLLGSSGVGKTSLVLRFQAGTFDEHSQPTIGASFTQKDVVTKDNTVARFKIWDTAGQEKFRGLTPMYFRGAEAAVLVYDVTQRSSFDELDFWVKELRKQTSGDVVLTIAANKCDLAPDATFDEAESFAASLGATLFQTSAKSDKNVTECFAHIAERLPSRKTKKVNKDTVDLLGNGQKKEPCAC
mmetsp:Transcript_121857/g.171458  ORF Transcript_121857/g.171458 Transcript_121857/m.171458 type:complete len:201 (+) Transcript_121857:201-803(+)